MAVALTSCPTTIGGWDYWGKYDLLASLKSISGPASWEFNSQSTALSATEKCRQACFGSLVVTSNIATTPTSVNQTNQQAFVDHFGSFLCRDLAWKPNVPVGYTPNKVCMYNKTDFGFGWYGAPSAPFCACNLRFCIAVESYVP